jgi:hypothetical protein
MSAEGYMKQKCFEALHTLVGDGDLFQRLYYANNYFVHLELHGWPQQYETRLRDIQQKLSKIARAKEDFAPMPVSRDEAKNLAEDILGAFVDVMGGL